MSSKTKKLNKKKSKMKLLFTLTSYFVILTYIACEKICYEGYGCFTNDYPFGGSKERPIGDLPEDPKKINTLFYLYNRAETTQPELISTHNTSTKFNTSIPTKIIIHGWLDDGFEDWLIEMKDVILEKEDVNVILVDWHGGSGWPYQTAVANTQIAGIETSHLIDVLVKTKGVSIKSFHLIGHSLGAHACGYAGKASKGLPRITALVRSYTYYCSFNSLYLQVIFYLYYWP